MTDRAQSGSAGLRGNRNIELMQNRRINGYDAYGVPQSLDDRDNFNNGLEVKATYFMQIFDRKKVDTTKGKGGSLSKQREQQLQMEQPILLQYSKEFKFDKRYKEKNPQIQLSQAQEQLEIAAQNKALLKNITGQDSQSTLKSFIYALKNNQVLIRFTNMEDKFDETANDKPMTKNYTIDLKEYAQLLYK